MPVSVHQFSLGTPPSRVITRGPRAGQSVPKFEVSIPGWDDIIHLTPTASLDSVERSFFSRQAKVRLQRSPSPEIFENVARIGQEIDNIQDALVTLSVAGRVIQSVVKRPIPGLRELAFAADAVNAINVFYPNTLVGAAASGVRRTARRVTGRSPYIASKSTKRQLGLVGASGVGTYRRRLAGTIATGKIGFGYGEAAQILQTSDWFWGFGLSLGGIFGGLQDAFFGYLRGARYDVTSLAYAPFDALRALGRGYVVRGMPQSKYLIDATLPRHGHKFVVDWPGVFPLVDDLYVQERGTFEKDVAVALEPIRDPLEKAALKTLNAIGAVQKATVNAAVTVWKAGKWVVGLRGDMSFEDHLELLIAQYLALQEVSEMLVPLDWGEKGRVVAETPEFDARIPFITNPLSRVKGEVAGILRDGPGRLPLEWLNDAPSLEARDFAEALVSGYAELLLRSLEGPHARVDVDSGPFGRVLLRIHDYNLLPPFQRTDAETLAYIRRVDDLLREDRLRSSTYEAVRRAWLDSFPGGVLD